MLLLPLLSIAAGMTLSTAVLSDVADIHVDTLHISPIGSANFSSDSSLQRTVELKQANVKGLYNAVPDTIVVFPQQVVPLKKNLTVVKNSNEVNFPKVVDSNPLLTEIVLYDPIMYRVWPQGPQIINDENLIECVRPKPLFLPLVFSLYQPDYSLKEKQTIDTLSLFSSQEMDSLMRVFRREYEALQHELRFLRKMESSMIRNVQYTKDELPEADPLVYILKEENIMLLEKPPLTWMNNTTHKENSYPNVVYNPWSKRGNFKLQFSETYLSPNWSKGGESTMAGLAAIYLEANYNDLKNVQFDNNLEWKIGLNTVSTDSLRNLNVSSDQLRAVSKLGIKMRDNWFYSLSSEFTTQTLNNYRKNTMNLLTSFLSPAKLFVSLGVDYKKTNKKSGYALSVMLSPVTYKANYLYDIKNMNPKSYGIDPGKHFGSEMGSKVSSTIAWQLSEKLNWKSKVYYFTDYTYIDSEWENTVDLSLNNYFSTQFYFCAKMDDRLKRKPGDSLIQLQQLLSFGMTYRF